MDRTAIEKIEQLSNDANAIPADYAERVTVVGGALVNLEPYAAKRFRFRAQYDTHSVDDFIDYIGERTENPPIYVNADKMSANTRFNLGDASNPGHGDDKASLALRITPEWAAISGRQEWLSQQDAVLFLQDWSHTFLQGYDESGAAMSLNEVVAAIRRIKVDKTASGESTVKTFGGTRATLEDTQVSTRMVDTLDFELEPYVGLEKILVRVQVQLALAEHRPPQVKFRLLQAEAWKDRNAQAFVELLRSKANGRVLSGTLSI